VLSVHGPGRFLGELDLLTGQASFVTAVVREAGEVLLVDAHRLQDLLVQEPTLCDVLLRAFLIRRSLLIGLGTGLRIIGSRHSPDTRRLREFVARNRVPHSWIDLEGDAGAEALLRRLGVRPDETPVVIWRGEHVLRHPSITELAQLIGLRPRREPTGVCDLVVVGAGPAGLAAAVYGASEGLATLSLEAIATGGQAGTSSRIENYLGFPAGVSGAELADRAVLQAEKFGAGIAVPAEATGLERGDGLHVIHLGDGSTVEARTVIIATGVRYRRLDVPRLDDLEGSSVFYAATWMESQLCAGDPVAVVGGGNSAGQATVFLARTAQVVHLVIREGELTANMSRYLADRIERNPNVQVHLHTEVRELRGDETLRALVVEDNRTGERRELAARALFVFIGAEPHVQWTGGQLALDPRGYILTGPEAGAVAAGDGSHRQVLETSEPGIFAVGDVRSGSIKRVASAVGEGSMAVRLVYEHLAGERTLDRSAHR
jgi:thioredoxin reductase (NADPH)